MVDDVDDDDDDDHDDDRDDDDDDDALASLGVMPQGGRAKKHLLALSRGREACACE